MRAFCFQDEAPTWGCLSYEYGALQMGLALPEDSGPLGTLRKYHVHLLYDGESETVELCGDEHRFDEVLGAFRAEASSCAPAVFTGPLSYSLNKNGYKKGVEETLEAIRDGYTYQLNLTTRVTTQATISDPMAFFLDVFERNPAEHFAYMQVAEHDLFCTSPERFLLAEQGKVLSQPIKGTLRFDEYSPGLEKKLTESPKESAELSMIVDLIRNDISMNCEYGSVQVNNHKSVFKVDNLLQMYSDVSGTMRQNRDVLDLMLDAFPGGSITGCPKLSSMQIIRRLEPHPRSFYCGAFFKIDGPRELESNIAIRTAVHDRATNEFSFYMGSGITVDSDPQSEYEETMAKGGKFFALMGQEPD